MLKSLNDNTNCNTNGYCENDNNNNNLLGFSLSSPYIRIEGKNRDPPHLFDHSSIPTSSCLFSPHFIHPKSVSFGVVGEKDGFLHSPLSVKSDGSLCIERSQTGAMGLNSSPKLEDFLGSAGQQYRAEDREEIPSLDRIFYSQNVVDQDSNRQPSLDFLQHPTRERGEIQLHQNPYFYGLHCQNMNQAPIDTQVQNNQLVDELPCLKNWIVGCYTDHLPLNQQINCTMNDNGGGSASAGDMSRGDLQSLSLSMSPGSQSSCVTTPLQISSNDTECLAIETMKKNCVEVASKQTMHRKSIETFGQRTSQYRGVTRHRWTGRYEAHLWDNSCRKEGQARKGRQVYLGGYDKEVKAARAYDLAALKYWGSSTHINFPFEDYQQELEKMKDMSRQEYVAHLRRRSSGFSRGASIYRGVTRHHQHGRWQARIGRVAGNKDLYLGTFSTQEEAAEAYDIAAIKFRGVNAVTNFDISCYNPERIMASNTLPAREPNIESIQYPTAAQKTDESVQVNNTATSNFSDCEMVLYQPPMPQQHNMGDSAAFLVSNSRCSSQVTVGDECANVGAHFSNSSSLVTSLNRSSEASPDRNDASVYFTKTSPISNKFISSATNLNPWIPSAQIGPVPISRAHVPVFSTWGNM